MVIDKGTHVLTPKALEEMEPHYIFACGYHYDIKWVGVRGGISDWAIYFVETPVKFMDSEPTFEWIQKHGDKLHDENRIKALVFCTESAFKKYRY